MACKMSVKMQAKALEVVEPHLDMLLEVHDDMKSTIGKIYFDATMKSHKKVMHDSLRKMKQCVFQLRKAFTPKATVEKKRDGQKKSVHLALWHAARKSVDSEIAGTGIVKKMKTGSVYHDLVTKKRLSMH